MPSKEFMSAAVNIMDIALGIEVGICSNRVLERNTIMPLTAVNREMPITPRTGVHLKKLPPGADDIKAERKPTMPFPKILGPRIPPERLSPISPINEPNSRPLVSPFLTRNNRQWLLPNRAVRQKLIFCFQEETLRI